MTVMMFDRRTLIYAYNENNVYVVCSTTTSVTAIIATTDLDHLTSVIPVPVRPVLETVHRFVAVQVLSASTQVYFTLFLIVF